MTATGRWTLCLFWSTTLWASIGATTTELLRGRQAQSVTPTGRITKLRLMNTVTDEPIAGYDPLSAMTLIDMTKLNTSSLSVEAVTEGTVGSVQWTIQGRITDTENSARWALCGNRGRDFFRCGSLVAGTNTTITATPFAGKSATGTRYPTVSIRLALYESSVLSLTLVDSLAEVDLFPLLPQSTVDFSVSPIVNIRANVLDPSLSPGSISFNLQGATSSYDRIVNNSATYWCFGEQANGVSGWKLNRDPGTYKLTVSAFAEPNAQGRPLASTSVNFLVTKPAKDGYAPNFVNVTVQTPVVNLSSSNVARFEVQARDEYAPDEPGVATIGLMATGRGTRPGDPSSLQIIALRHARVVPPSRRVTQSVPLILPAFAAHGVYFPSVMVQDYEDAMVDMFNRRKEFPSALFTVTGAADRPRFMSEFGFSPSTVIRSAGPVELQFTLVLNGCTPTFAAINLELPETGIGLLTSTSFATQVVRNQTRAVFTGVVNDPSQFTPTPGTYRLELFLQCFDAVNRYSATYSYSQLPSFNTTGLTFV